MVAVLTAASMAAIPASTRANEVTARLYDVEIKWSGVWEEPAIHSLMGQPPNSADIYVDLLVTQPHTFKLVIYSQVEDSLLATTFKTVTSAGHVLWLPTITVPLDNQSLGVYVYYWNGSAYVLDDTAFGWTPVHGVVDNDNVGLWGPNQFSLPTNWRSGDFATAQQYFWWWDNSGFPAQTVGTQHLNRLKAWGNRSDAWLQVIEFRRVDRPYGHGVTVHNAEGWDFKYAICGRTCTYGYYEWSSDFPGIRIGDVEELSLGGDEEAQFELNNEQVANFLTVTAEEPDIQYGNMYFLRVQFRRLSGYQGLPFYLRTETDLQSFFSPSCVPFCTDYREDQGYLRTSF